MSLITLCSTYFGREWTRLCERVTAGVSPGCRRRHGPAPALTTLIIFAFKFASIKCERIRAELNESTKPRVAGHAPDTCRTQQLSGKRRSPSDTVRLCKLKASIQCSVRSKLVMEIVVPKMT